MPERSNISTTFIGSDRKVVEEAVRKSDLPEGINIVKGYEIETAQKPFVVITWCPNTTNAVQAFRLGALNYVTATVDVKELISALSSHNH